VLSILQLLLNGRHGIVLASKRGENECYFGYVGHSGKVFEGKMLNPTGTKKHL